MRRLIKRSQALLVLFFASRHSSTSFADSAPGVSPQRHTLCNRPLATVSAPVSGLLRRTHHSHHHRRSAIPVRPEGTAMGHAASTTEVDPPAGPQVHWPRPGRPGRCIAAAVAIGRRARRLPWNWLAGNSRSPAKTREHTSTLSALTRFVPYRESREEGSRTDAVATTLRRAVALKGVWGLPQHHQACRPGLAVVAAALESVRHRETAAA